MGYQERHATDIEWHHVFNRGARHQAVFFDDIDRSVFVGLIEAAAKKHSFSVAAWCLMGNHYHLVVRAPVVDLSVAMQLVASRYTKAFNRRHGFDGALFRGRFASVEVRSDAQLLAAVRYVHRNPFDIPGVTSLDAYRWSSHPIYAGRRPVPVWMNCDVVLGLVGGSDRYRDFLEAA